MYSPNQHLAFVGWLVTLPTCQVFLTLSQDDSFTCLPRDGGYHGGIRKHHVGSTLRLLCSPFLVLTCFLLRDYSILPKKELHRSLQVGASALKALFGLALSAM